MIRSMTGFGEASAHIEGIHYFLEIRSLNNKYFKASIRLSDELQGLEPELESALRRRLTRGSVVLIARCSTSSVDAAHEINQHALASYIEQIRKTPQVASGDVPLELGPLLTLPGVIQPPADEEKRIERAREAMSSLLDRAIEELMAMRAREGQMLHEDLMGQHKAISEHLDRVRLRAPSVVEEYHQRLRTRIETMLSDSGLNVEPGDLVREVAVYAERSDIAEEVTRLEAHLDQFKELLARTGEKPLGRTLDFLTQEMLREANTIASKSNDAAIARDIVEIKGSIDRIKEQVQNVE